MADWTLHLGDCLSVLPTLPAGMFDACICDPPYPEIDRAYGRLTETEWHDLMHAVVPEVRRVLKPRGSAVFVLQPNSERVGRMRPWLWEFLAWLCREWNLVQDAYWWNHAILPNGGCNAHGLLRASLKMCVWCGPPDCSRHQAAVLWGESEANVAHRLYHRGLRGTFPSGNQVDYTRHAGAAVTRGGTVPFNVIPLPGTDWKQSREAKGHPGTTPLALCDWWVRYLVPPGGAVLDPFAGSGTVGLAALRRGCTFVGVEKEAEYVETARKRLAEVQGPLFATTAGG